MIGCIVVAAGYGSLRNDNAGRPIPKVIERVNGLPMIAYPLRMATRAGIAETVVVVNPRDEEIVVRTIKNLVHVHAVSSMPTIAVQPQRHGSADAVAHAIPYLRERNVHHALITYGDMPMWSAQSAQTLCAAHRESHIVTMATVWRGPEYPALDRYGRVLRDRYGGIKMIIEHNDPLLTPRGYAIRQVNPSFWVWDLEWLTDAIPKVRPAPKRDGFGDELHMPPLIEMITSGGMTVHEVAFRGHMSAEALGVNTLDELHALTKQFAH